MISRLVLALGWCSAGLAKLWMALSAQVDQKKNEKHIHTDGRRRKAIGSISVTWAPKNAVNMTIIRPMS